MPLLDALSMLIAAWTLSFALAVAGFGLHAQQIRRRKLAMLLVQIALAAIWLHESALIFLLVALANHQLLQWQGHRAKTANNGQVKGANGLVRGLSFVITLTPLLALKSMTAFDWSTLWLNFALSFFCLQQLGGVLDRLNPHLPPPNTPATSSTSLLDWLNFSIFFPTLLAGPILRWPQFREHMTLPPEWRWSNASNALVFAVQAIFRRCVLAVPLGAWGVSLIESSQQSSENLGFWGWAFAAVILRWSLYHDFAAQNDLSRAAASHMGLDLPLNFRQPFAAQNLLDFWRRWHVSLSSWIRDYVYLPLIYGPLRRFPTQMAVFASAMLSFALFGLWHQLSWAMILMGVWQGLGVLLETQIRPQAWPHKLRPLLTPMHGFLMLMFVFWPTLLFHISPGHFLSSLGQIANWQISADLQRILALAPWRWEAYLALSLLWFASGEWRDSHEEVGAMTWINRPLRRSLLALVVILMLLSIFIWAQFPKTPTLPYLSM
ncbi:MAG TPA: MBOAT family O-acyltransferase [Pseudobdellovibrionaceae bacterium]|nr:MBOAT family O-acyltransferase [Pseudobdellovibrionaceae bacterium]